MDIFGIEVQVVDYDAEAGEASRAKAWAEFLTTERAYVAKLKELRAWANRLHETLDPDEAETLLRRVDTFVPLHEQLLVSAARRLRCHAPEA